MASLELFPIEVEERMLLASADNFWSGIDDWDLLEEVAKSAGVANPDVANPVKKSTDKVRSLDTVSTKYAWWPNEK